MAKKPVKNTTKKKTTPKIVPIEKKPKTIRDVPTDDSQAFNELSEKFNITPGELFSKLVNMMQEGADSVDVSVYTEEIKTLKSIITMVENKNTELTNKLLDQNDKNNTTDLHDQISELNKKLQALEQENSEYVDKLTGLADELTKAKGSAELTTLLSEKEAIIETLSDKITELENQPPSGVKLDASKNEFVAFITPDNFKDARKCRPFLAKDGYVSGDPGKYPNELINVAINYFLWHRYDKIVNP